VPDNREDIVSDEPRSATSTPVADIGPAAVDVEEIQRQRDEYYDLLLRKTAEFENYRKRVDRDRQNASEAAAADLLGELLPLLDDLERALTADTGAEGERSGASREGRAERSELGGVPGSPPSKKGAEAYRRGVELIHRQLIELLRKRGVRPIEAVGTDFDPHYHQAVVHEAVEGRRDGEVIEEFRRGYMLGDRLLRPSMVKVAKG
jgi:molecular chaperone GrpE